jgi:hypothetical protein
MADIFGTDASVGGTFRGNKFKMTVANAGDIAFEGALVQQLQLSYQRQVTRFWALGTRAQYYIEGRTEGQGQMSRVVGPQGLIDNLATVLADFCTVATRSATLSSTNDPCNKIVNSSGASTGALTGLSLTMGGIIANGITFGADANQFIISSSISLMFASLSKNSPVNA